MLMKATKQQKQRLWAACKARALPNDTIRDMIADETGNRTQHSSEMSNVEIQHLIEHVNRSGDTQKNRMRKKLLAMAHKLDWQTVINGKVVADMERIDNWCKQYGMYGKPFQQHSYKELCKLVSQFEKVYASYLQ